MPTTTKFLPKLGQCLKGGIRRYFGRFFKLTLGDFLLKPTGLSLNLKICSNL